MSKITYSLRYKLSLTFAIFGATISLVLSLGLFFTAHTLGERLMDETLRSEIDDYIYRRSHNPNALLPSTVSIHGYFLAQGQNNQPLPPELVSLREGIHQLKMNEIPYRIAVLNKNGDRYYMLFDERRQNHREETFISDLVSGALIMILISAWVGWLLAGRVVAPIEVLALRVFKAKPEGDADTVAQGFNDDEIGQLAQVFSAYLKRMREFIEREQHFTSDVSHELRTPLAVVQGVVEIMKEDMHLDSKQQQRIARIGRVNTEMVHLTTALLLMAREYNDDAVVQACDVMEVVSSVIEMNRHLLSEFTTVKFLCHSHPSVGAERTLLSIVVGNLVRNAFTYTLSGSVSIFLEDNCLMISDTGTGISREEIGKVFQQHYKGVYSSGSGIGLSLVKRICDRYGWEIYIDSTEGKGTSAQLIFNNKSPS